jgi:hypothetical protein
MDVQEPREQIAMQPPPQKATPEHRRRTFKRLKRQAWTAQASQYRWLLLLLAALTAVAAHALLAIPTGSLALAAIAVLAALLLDYALNPSISIHPFDLPEDIKHHGWSGDITARHFRDALLRIQVAGEREGQRSFSLRPEGPLPDFDLPTTGLKASTFVDIFRFLVRRPRRDLTAEVIGCPQSYRLIGRVDGATFDVAVSGPAGLDDALQAAAVDLTRAMALPYYLLSRIPQPSCALHAATEAIERAETSTSDRAFAAKFAASLTLDGIRNAAFCDVREQLSNAKQYATRAFELSPDDAEAMYLYEAPETLPSPDSSSISDQLESASDSIGKSLSLGSNWQRDIRVNLAERSPMLRRLFFNAVPTVSKRLTHVDTLQLQRKVIEEVGNNLEVALEKSRTEEDKTLGEFQLFGNMSSIAYALKGCANSITIAFEEAGSVTSLHDTDKAALVQNLNLFAQLAASVDSHTSWLLTSGELKKLADRGLPTQSDESAQEIRTVLTEARKAVAEWARRQDVSILYFRRVHPPLPHPRAAQRVPPHSPLRPAVLVDAAVCSHARMFR